MDRGIVQYIPNIFEIYCKYDFTNEVMLWRNGPAAHDWSRRLARNRSVSCGKTASLPNEISIAPS